MLLVENVSSVRSCRNTRSKRLMERHTTRVLAPGSGGLAGMCTARRGRPGRIRSRSARPAAGPAERHLLLLARRSRRCQ
jgi:hypothetical protein